MHNPCSVAPQERAVSPFSPEKYDEVIEEEEVERDVPYEVEEVQEREVEQEVMQEVTVPQVSVFTYVCTVEPVK